MYTDKTYKVGKFKDLRICFASGGISGVDIEKLDKIHRAVYLCYTEGIIDSVLLSILMKKVMDKAILLSVHNKKKEL